MRLLFIFSLVLNIARATTMYEGDGFLLSLEEEDHFILRPKDQVLKFNYSGNYHIRMDSLILTTYYTTDQSTILAIYTVNDLQLTARYMQMDMQKMLPKKLYLRRELYDNGATKREIYWEDYPSRSYIAYIFNLDSQPLIISTYQNGVKDGKELLFCANVQNTIRAVLHYKQGVLSNKSYYYELVEGDFSKVKLVKVETYSNGHLKKTKMPEAQPVFYTSHF